MVQVENKDYRPDVFVMIGASNHSEGAREKHDYYATDPEAVKELLEFERFDKYILEPCCGEGHISKVLEDSGYFVKSTDLIDRNFGKGGVDLFKYREWGGDIISNPPYKIAKEFVDHMLKIMQAGKKLAVFLKIQFLESQSRRPLFDTHPPKRIYVFSKRKSCAKNGRFDLYPSSAVCYAWFIWEKGFKGDPIIKWI